VSKVLDMIIARVPPPHSHKNNEELVYVLEGTLRVTVPLGSTRYTAVGSSRL